MIDLDDRNVLIVGGTSGIGLATAKAATALGARVTVASRNPQSHTNALAELGGDVRTLALDVTDQASLTRGLLHKTWDHVVVSAAETPTGPARTLDRDAAQGAMTSKFWGAYDVARLVAISDGGSLTLISGFLANRPSPEATLQGAINAAIEGLMRGLALELKPVRVNAVSPGTTDTPLWNEMEAAARRRMFEATGAKLPVGSVGHADDIAQAVIFLMRNAFASGSVVLVDGGGSIA